MKKLILILTIATLMTGLNSCYINKKLDSQKQFQKYASTKTDISKKSKSVKVVYLETKDGENILFNKKYPGRIVDSAVVGMPQVRFLFSEIDSLNINMQPLQYIWKSGNKYKVIGQNSLGYICCTNLPLATPFEDIRLIKIKKYTPHIAGSVALVAGVSLVTIGVIQIEKAIDDMVVTFPYGW